MTSRFVETPSLMLAALPLISLLFAGHLARPEYPHRARGSSA